MKSLFIILAFILSSCTHTYHGAITEYDPDNQPIVRYIFESNQPMLMRAGNLESDSRIKPLVESLMLELGYKKETGGNYSDNDSFNWGK